MGPDIVQTHQEFFPDLHHLHHLYSLPRHLRHSLSSPNPHDLHESIQIEIEKERIREEIMISEIARRRVLEAEVMRELMMERESALLTNGDGFFNSYRSSPLMEPASPMRLSHMGARTDESSLEERITSLLNGKRENGRFETQRGTPDLRNSEVIKPVSEGGHEKKKLIFLGKPDENISGSKKKAVTPPPVLTRESGGFQTLPFIRTADLIEVKAVSEGGHEKQKVNLLGKADENISGSKRKASTPPRVDASDFPWRSGGILHKKPKKEWICSICQINSTSERALNDHLGGKKHKSKEAAFTAAEKAGKNCTTVDAKVEQEVRFTAEPLLLLENSVKDSLIKSVLVDKAQEKGYPKNINNYPFWCEMCKVGTSCEKDMFNHEKGRKHVNRLSNHNGGDGKNVTKGNVDGIMSKEFVDTENQSDKISMLVFDEAEDEKNTSEANNVDETANDASVKIENQELVDTEKSENHSDKISMLVSEDAEDGTNIIEVDTVDETVNDEFVKTENHKDEEDMVEEDDWSMYITELENAVTDDGIVEHEDDGAIYVTSSAICP